MNVQPDSKEKTESDKIEVPDIVGYSADDAIGILGGAGLKYDMKDGAEEENFIVTKQYPSAGSKVKKGTRVFIYN